MKNIKDMFSNIFPDVPCRKRKDKESISQYLKDVYSILFTILKNKKTTENVKDYEFIDCVDVAKKYAKELRTTKNCDVVVVAIHDYDYETKCEHMDDCMSDVLGMTENDFYQITNYFIR